MNKKTGIVTLGVMIAIIFGAVYAVSVPVQNEAFDDVARAVVIDQLHNEIPNLEYQNKTMTLLQDAGYEVDLYTTSEITVDFYRKLPTLNYDIVVVRTHSVAAGTVEDSPSLLTGEVYDIERHYQEQLLGQVKKAVPFLPDYVERVGWEVLRNQTYFTVGSKMVSEVMYGDFDDSVIILAGCDTLSSDHLANAFLDKGASVVVGWDGLISANDNDAASLKLLEKILEEDVRDAVSLVGENFTSTSKYDPVLKVYSKI